MTNLRVIRESHNISQRKLAACIGCSSVVYSRYEVGSRTIPWEVLVRLADYYNVAVDYLIGRTEVDATSLSEYEITLIESARLADDRARADALRLLQSNRIGKDPEPEQELEQE